jgi:phytoene dehydrogenase-like protein
MHDVLIIGGGLAGLACARELTLRGVSWQLLEATDRVGGRVATDDVDGFLLDRGFQVLLDSYPEARRVLDYGELNLRPFHSGARIWLGDRFTTVSNPLEHPQHALSTAFAPIGSLADKFRILQLRQRIVNLPFEQTLLGRERTTHEYLRSFGFSEQIMERFFAPFLGGVFLENALTTSSRKFEFVFQMFATGKATLPAAGMGRIPRQMAAWLDARAGDSSRIRLNAPTWQISEENGMATVQLEDGETLTARHVVVATDARTAARLLQTAGHSLEIRRSNATMCLYFAVHEPPTLEPMLLLNGTGRGLVNNVCVPSIVAPLYAPQGEHLVSVSILGIPAMDDETVQVTVRSELDAWFGKAVREWRFLRSYRIQHALADQTPPALTPPERPARFTNALFVAGDHRATASIQGALETGRHVAEQIALL